MSSTLDDKIKEVVLIKFPGAVVNLEDLRGDGSAYLVDITHASFNNMGLLDQHKAVMSVFRDYLDSNLLHAISIKTRKTQSL